MQKILALVLFIAFLWVFIAGLLMLMLWPDWPHTPIQWLLFLGLGPPVYVLGEAFLAGCFLGIMDTTCRRAAFPLFASSSRATSGAWSVLAWVVGDWATVQGLNTPFHLTEPS